MVGAIPALSRLPTAEPDFETRLTTPSSAFVSSSECAFVNSGW
jgi:hypothetical protein